MITDTDYTDDIAFLANTPTQAESLLHSLKQAASGIGLHVNTNKTEFMCFNWRGELSILNGRSLKLVDKFTYFGSSISSTENDNTWTAINRLSVIWKSDLSNKIKQQSCQYYYIDVPHGYCLSIWSKSLLAIAQEYYELYWTKSGGNILQNSSCIATYHPSKKPSKLDEQDMLDIAGEVRMISNDVLLWTPSYE